MLQFKRGKGKNNADYSMLDLYEAYKLLHPKSTVDYKTYVNVCVLFNRFCMLEIICRGSEITIPVLGSLSVRKYKALPKIGRNNELLIGGVPVDWKATKEYWEKNPQARAEKKLIRNLNEHTNGYRYRFFWEKPLNKVANVKQYSFIPLRKYSRMINEILTDENSTIDFYLDATKLIMRNHANG